MMDDIPTRHYRVRSLRAIRYFDTPVEAWYELFVLHKYFAERCAVAERWAGTRWEEM